MNPPDAPVAAATPTHEPISSPRRRARAAAAACGSRSSRSGSPSSPALVASVGWGPVAANLSRIGGWFLGLTALYALAQGAFAAGWWVLTGPRPRPVGFGGLFAAYLAGDSINYFTSVGGEPVKAELLKESSASPARSRP